jgi:hypothetical protein
MYIAKGVAIAVKAIGGGIPMYILVHEAGQ